MNDDKIRELLHEAHKDDRPPPFAMPEAPRRRLVSVLVFAMPVVALVVGLLMYTKVAHHKPAPDLALPAIHYPTDVLLPATGLSIPEPTKGLLQ